MALQRRLPVGIHGVKPLLNLLQKNVIQQGQHVLPAGHIHLADLVGLFVGTGFNFDNKFVVPGVKAYSEMSMRNVLQIAHRFKRFFYKDTCWLLLLGMGLWGCSDQTQQEQEAAQFFLKGNLQLAKREYKEAIRYYTEAIGKKPDFADAYNNRGLASFRNGNREAALADYTKAIATDPTFEPAYLNRADVRLETGDAAGSLTDLQTIEKTYRDSTFYQTRRGDAFVRLAKPADAQVAYDKALLLNPANAEALTNRGALFFSQKAYEPARQDIERALQLNPRQDAALNNLSLILAQAGKFSEALPYVERALDQQPTQPYYLNNRAFLLLMLGRAADALPILTQSLRIDDQNAWAHRNLGIYYLQQKKPAQALAELQQAETRDASVDQLYYYIGQAQLAQDNPTAACEAWRRGEQAGDNRAKAERLLHCP